MDQRIVVAVEVEDEIGIVRLADAVAQAAQFGFGFMASIVRPSRRTARRSSLSAQFADAIGTREQIGPPRLKLPPPPSS
jgi:hypothetical protein